jgi:hypothetical protein
MLKELLTSAPVLNIADPNENCVVCTDARTWWSPHSKWTCHLYESKNLKEHERNSATHDLEFAAIFHALKMWRHYLTGKSFELITDHSGLKYLFEQPILNSRKIIWLEFLSEYDFDINHIKGKENKVVDALSRRVHLMHATTVGMDQSELKKKNFSFFCYISALPTGKGKLIARICTTKSERVCDKGGWITYA